MATFTLRINGRTHEMEGEAGDSLLPSCATTSGSRAASSAAARATAAPAPSCWTTRSPARARCVWRLSLGSQSRPSKPLPRVIGCIRSRKRFSKPKRSSAATAHLEWSSPRSRCFALTRIPPNRTSRSLLDRNVCRCGTYPRIVQAIKLAAQRARRGRLPGQRHPRERRSGARGPRHQKMTKSNDTSFSEEPRYRFESGAPRLHAHLRDPRRRPAGRRVDAPDAAAQESGRGGQADRASADLSAWLHIDERGAHHRLHRQDRNRSEHPDVARSDRGRRARGSARRQ